MTAHGELGALIVAASGAPVALILGYLLGRYVGGKRGSRRDKGPPIDGGKHRA